MYVSHVNLDASQIVAVVDIPIIPVSSWGVLAPNGGYHRHVSSKHGVCKYRCRQIYKHMYIHMQACAHTCFQIYIHMYVYLYVYVYTHDYTWIRMKACFIDKPMHCPSAQHHPSIIPCHVSID